MKAIDPQVTIFYCLIHMGNHASMKLSKMDIAKREVIQVVNCNTVRLLNRIFNQTFSITRKVAGSIPNGVTGIFQ